uniref:Uncharacterized protein n=1 Tax=Peronospora matthiolae TaxID=2874970 RepID=A0AAV1VHT7_9STRA
MKLFFCLVLAAVAASRIHGRAQERAGITDSVLLPAVLPLVLPVLLPALLGIPDATSGGPTAISETPEVSGITGPLPIPGASPVPALPVDLPGVPGSPALPVGLPGIPGATALPAGIPTNSNLPIGGLI